MKIGFIGLGKMGFNMVEHLLELGHKVTAFDLSAEAVAAIAEKGATAASSLQHVVGDLPKPRVVWMMVPAGKAVDAVIDGLLPFLDKGDIVIDGGNSRYTDSVARAERLTTLSSRCCATSASRMVTATWERRARATSSKWCTTALSTV